MAIESALFMLATSNDTDGNGLIEVSDLEELNAIRFDLNGDGMIDARAYRYRLIQIASYETAFGISRKGNVSCSKYLL